MWEKLKIMGEIKIMGGKKSWPSPSKITIMSSRAHYGSGEGKVKAMKLKPSWFRVFLYFVFIGIDVPPISQHEKFCYGDLFLK